MNQYPARLFGGIVAGCVAAILAAAGTVYITEYVVSPWPPPNVGVTDLGPSDYARISTLTFTLFALPVAAGAALLLGVPTLTYMHRHGLRSTRSFLGAGAFISVVTAVACAIANHFMFLATGRELALAVLAMFVAGPVGALTARARIYRRSSASGISSNNRWRGP